MNIILLKYKKGISFKKVHMYNYYFIKYLTKRRVYFKVKKDTNIIFHIIKKVTIIFLLYLKLIILSLFYKNK